MSQFQEVKVIEVKKETDDTVSIAFDVPASFNYVSGQYITIKKEIAGEDIRRSYSLCSAPFENDFRVAVKEIANGKMSSFLNNTLKQGDLLELMPPMGNFIMDAQDNKHYVAFAAGSGITPIISMVKTVLTNTNSRFTLYFANKTDGSTIFKTELDQLKLSYPERFQLYYIYTQQESVNKLFEGRITRSKFEQFVKEDVEMLNADGFFMCGPEKNDKRCF
jgi:ring-1,2-phenylacetyl-CoA epoxidase subunit PaaE